MIFPFSSILLEKVPSPHWGAGVYTAGKELDGKTAPPLWRQK
jgi:hypothetical protein